jgi:ATP-binding cassette subfamily C (CFTR/MRP) protein 1
VRGYTIPLVDGSQLPVEAPSILPHRPAPQWPDQGTVAFDNYATRYRPGLDLVLRGITARVRGNEKVSHLRWRSGA